MPLDLSIGALINAVSGLLLAGFGLYVATRVPRRRANVAFGVFAVSLGIALVPNNLVPTIHPLWLNPPFLWTYVALYTVAAGALAYFGFAVPRPVTPRERRLVIPAALLGAAFTANGTIGFMRNKAGALGDYTAQGLPTETFELVWPVLVLKLVTLWLLLGTFVFVITLLALRYPRFDRDGTSSLRQQTLLFGTALILWPAALAGSWLPASDRYPTDQRIASVAVILAVSALWLWNTERAKSPQASRGARNLALMSIAVMLASYIVTILWAAYVDPVLWIGTTPTHGIARTLGVVVLGYGLLRHQLFGLDVKVKWTVRQSTIAAIFIATFFIVSEGAQVIFGDIAGNEFIGIFAAGGLLFALAPIQQFAERVSDRAMPGVKAAGEMTDDERRGFYLGQLRAAYKDGTVNSSERLMLLRARQWLGIRAEEAEKLEGEVLHGKDRPTNG